MFPKTFFEISFCVFHSCLYIIIEYNLWVFSSSSLPVTQLNLPLKVYRFSQGQSQTECFKCQTKRAEYHGFLNDILRLYTRLPSCSGKLMNVGPCRAQVRTEACCTMPSKQENKVQKRIKTRQSPLLQIIKLIIIWFNAEQRTLSSKYWT